MCECNFNGRWHMCCGARHRKAWAGVVLQPPITFDEPQLSLFDRVEIYGADPNHFSREEWAELYEFLKGR